MVATLTLWPGPSFATRVDVFVGAPVSRSVLASSGLDGSKADTPAPLSAQTPIAEQKRLDNAPVTANTIGGV